MERSVLLLEKLHREQLSAQFCSELLWVCSRYHSSWAAAHQLKTEKSALPAARTISHERHNVAKHVWNSYPLLHLWPAKTTVWQLANEACAGWSGRPCVAHDSEGHSRHQMGQDGVFRRKWLKLLTANTISSCGHASILHIRTALLFSLLICLSGFSNQRGFWRSFYFYMRAMKVYIKIQLPKWARMWLLRVKF